MDTTPQEQLGIAHSLPIVFIHGFMQTPREWDDVVRALEQQTSNMAVLSQFRTQILTPSIAPTSAAESTLEALAANVCNQAQKAAQRTGAPGVILVGYSMGGRIALECLRQRPNLISALVLESAGLGPETKIERVEIAQRNAAMVQRLQSEDIERFVDWWETLPLFASQLHLNEGAREDIRIQRRTANLHSLALLLEHAGAHTMPLADQARYMLVQTSIPVWYFSGTYDTKYHLLSQTLPQNVHVNHFDAGHNVHREQLVAYVTALADILAIIMRSLSSGGATAL